MRKGECRDVDRKGRKCFILIFSGERKEDGSLNAKEVNRKGRKCFIPIFSGGRKEEGKGREEKRKHCLRQ